MSQGLLEDQLPHMNMSLAKNNLGKCVKNKIKSLLFKVGYSTDEDRAREKMYNNLYILVFSFQFCFMFNVGAFPVSSKYGGGNETVLSYGIFFFSKRSLEST